MSQSKMEVDEADEIPDFPKVYWNTPITALKMTTRMKLAQFLDLDGELILFNGEDIVTNYHGLAELVGFTYLEMQNLARHPSPTRELLDRWAQKQLLEPTVGKLWDCLVKMDRKDVLLDCFKNFVKDCKAYEDLKQMERAEFYPIQDDEVTNTDMVYDEEEFSTKNDVINRESGEAPVTYDAFVCYTYEPNDIRFVKEMLLKLEGPEYNLRLFVPGRDDLPGSAQYVINAYLIEQRCKRMIIIASHNLEQSPACDFYVRFAHALSPGARSKKLIPVLIDPGVRLPRILKFLAVCDFTKEDMRSWIWPRLAAAICAPIERKSPDDYIGSVKQLQRVELTNSASYNESFSAVDAPSDSVHDGRGVVYSQGKSFNNSNTTATRRKATVPPKKSKSSKSPRHNSPDKQLYDCGSPDSDILPGDWVIPEPSSIPKEVPISVPKSSKSIFHSKKALIQPDSSSGKQTIQEHELANKRLTESVVFNSASQSLTGLKPSLEGPWQHQSLPIRSSHVTSHMPPRFSSDHNLKRCDDTDDDGDGDQVFV